MSATWSVSYETATIRAGQAPTKEEAEREAVKAHDTCVIKGLNPDALAWHAEEVPDEDRDARVRQFVNAEHRRDTCGRGDR